MTSGEECADCGAEESPAMHAVLGHKPCTCAAVPFPHWDANHPPRDTRPAWVRRAQGDGAGVLPPKEYR